MPKLKTSKTFSKRIKVTNSGIVKIGRVGKRHNLRRASQARKQSPLLSALSKTNIQHIRQLMPYSSKSTYARLRKVSNNDQN